MKKFSKITAKILIFTIFIINFSSLTTFAEENNNSINELLSQGLTAIKEEHNRQQEENRNNATEVLQNALKNAQASQTAPSALEALTQGAQSGTKIETAEENAKNTYNQESYSPTKIPKPNTLPGPNITAPNLEKKILTSQVLPRIASFIIGFAGVASLLFILLSGIQMMISLGEEEVYNKSKERIQWAIIGLIISMLSFIFVQIITNLNFVEQTQEETSTKDASTDIFESDYQQTGDVFESDYQQTGEVFERTP